MNIIIDWYIDIKSAQITAFSKAFFESKNGLKNDFFFYSIICYNKHNKDGQLFVPPKKIVYPPAEVEAYQRLNFCVVENGVSAAFVGIEPPLNICNKKIDYEMTGTVKDKIKAKKKLKKKIPNK